MTPTQIPKSKYRPSLSAEEIDTIVDALHQYAPKSEALVTMELFQFKLGRGILRPTNTSGAAATVGGTKQEPTLDEIAEEEKKLIEFMKNQGKGSKSSGPIDPDEL